MCPKYVNTKNDFTCIFPHPLESRLQAVLRVKYIDFYAFKVDSFHGSIAPPVRLFFSPYTLPFHWVAKDLGSHVFGSRLRAVASICFGG
jgi:hypothetical protein